MRSACVCFSSSAEFHFEMRRATPASVCIFGNIGSNVREQIVDRCAAKSLFAQRRLLRFSFGREARRFGRIARVLSALMRSFQGGHFLLLKRGASVCDGDRARVVDADAYSALGARAAGLLRQPSAGNRKKSNEHNDTHRKVKHVHSNLMQQKFNAITIDPKYSYAFLAHHLSLMRINGRN